MTPHVQDMGGGWVILSADFIAAMTAWPPKPTTEAEAPKSVLTPKPVKATKTKWKTKK